jgi:hypothetical protein
MSWRCCTCDQVWDTIPEDSVPQTDTGRVITYKFGDGSIHHIKKVRRKAAAVTVSVEERIRKIRAAAKAEGEQHGLEN